MLHVKKVSKSFGGVKALNKVSIKVERGTVNGLIGPNGSGKTTLFNVISGFYPPDSGKIIFEGGDITGLPPHKIFHKGICRTFQISDIRGRMTVLENMLLARKQVGEGVFDVFIKNSKVRAEEKNNVSKAMSILEKVRLNEMANEYASELSGGQRKLLDVGRILMADPKLFFLDEPMAGVNPTLAYQTLEIIKQLGEEGKTFILVEHNMKIINRVCDKVFVLCSGELIAEGTPNQIQKNDKVLDAYLARG